MPRLLQEGYPIIAGGEHRRSEKERIPKTDMVRQLNWDTTDDGLIESAPGYTTEFSIPKRRTIADFEFEGHQLDTVQQNVIYDEEWTGAGRPDDSVGTKSQGDFSLKHDHTAGGVLTSRRTASFNFLGTDFGSSDVIHLTVFVSSTASLTDVEIRFHTVFGVDFFSFTTVAASLSVGKNDLTVTLGSLASTGSPSLSAITDIEVESDATAAMTVHWDDCFVDVAVTTTQEPIRGLWSHEHIAGVQRFLMAASGDSIISHEATEVNRIGKLALSRDVHMISANDMVIATNGSDDVQRWDPADPVFRDLGVPRPPDTLTSASSITGGNVAAGSYFAVVTFDMGVHGEGLPQATPHGVTVGAGDDTIDYTNIPIGPPGTINRIIYRTVVSGTSIGPFKLDIVVSGNTSTSQSSTNSDTQITDTLIEDGNQPPVLRYMAFAQNTLFGAGKPGSPSSVFFSDITRAANRTIEQWKVTNELQLDRDDGDIIVGMISHRGVVYVFKRFSFYAIDPISLQFRKISSVYGALTQRSILDDGRRLLFWSPRRGPVEYVQGGSPAEIGIKIKARNEADPDPHDVNHNISSTTLNGIRWTTQNDFDAGIGGTPVPSFGSPVTTESVVTGAVRLIQGGAASQPGDLVPPATTTKTSVVLSGLNVILGNPNKVGDNDDDTRWVAISSDGSLEVDFTINFGTPKTINEITIISGASTAVTSDNLKITVQKEVGPSFVTIDSYTIPTDTANILPILTITKNTRVISFGTASHTTNKIKINMKMVLATGASAAAFLNTVIIREQGFVSSGPWTSDVVTLTSTPAEWGRILADIRGERPADGVTVDLFMRSGTGVADTQTKTFELIRVGDAPNTALIPLNNHVQFEARFQSDGRFTPELGEISLTFIPVIVGIIQPTFESNGIYYRNTAWFNLIPEGKAEPSEIIWKMHRNNSWSQHDDYKTSCWAHHGTKLFSGSSVTGAVFRNVEDSEGKTIRSKDGRVIPCFAETADSPLGFQHLEKTIRDYVVMARNEQEFFPRKSILVNPDLEEWTGNVPNGWTALPIVGNEDAFNRVRRDTSINNILSGFNAARLVHKDSTVTLTQTISLDNSKTYTIKFGMKLLSGVAPTLFRIREVTLGPGARRLQDDGTWKASTDTGFLANLTLPALSAQYVEINIPFTTLSDTSNAPSIELNIGYGANDGEGTVLVDNFSLRENPVSISRNLLITPIVDEESSFPTQTMNLLGDKLAVRSERFRLDQAQVRNVRFQLQHEELLASAKVLGLTVNYGVENQRDAD